MEMVKCCLFVIFWRVIDAISDGYLYPIPQPPPQFDEPSTSPPPIYLPPPPFQDEIPQIVPTYLPPGVYPPIGSPPLQDEILPPLDDTVVISAPTSRQVPLQIFNMSCLDSGDGNGYFRTSLRSTALSRVFPVLEASSSDCIITPINSDTFRIELEGQKMSDCGIRSCGTRMCLIVRMAMVPGLRIADDNLITLQCIPQETIVSRTKHLQINTQSAQGRSNSKSIAVASGGSQRKFEPQITLLRRNSGSNVFDQPVQQGSAVRLGDELLLRAAVRDGDGWRYSRMGIVAVRSTTTQRSVVLVDENGCRIPTVKSICPRQPQQINPLTIQLPFRAFLFQGAAPADELLLSVKMSGCLRPRDCYQNKICEDNNRNRAVRAVKNFTKIEEIDTVTDWESKFQFRVFPKNFSEELEKKTNFNGGSWIAVFVITMSLSAVCLVITVLLKPTKHRLYF